MFYSSFNAFWRSVWWRRKRERLGTCEEEKDRYSFLWLTHIPTWGAKWWRASGIEVDTCRQCRADWWGSRQLGRTREITRQKWREKNKTQHRNHHLEPVVWVKTALLLRWTYVGVAMFNREDLHVPADLQGVHQVDWHAILKWLEGVAVDVNLDRMNWSTVIFYIVGQTFLGQKNESKIFDSLQFRGKSKNKL